MSQRRAGPVDDYVAKRILERRRELGMTQVELGVRAGGITFQQVQKYEIGQNRVSAGRLYALAHSLGVPVGYFYAGYGEQEPEAKPVTLVEALRVF